MEDHNLSKPDQEDPIIMYLIVRESLNMGVGKIAAQCAHASQLLVIKYYKSLWNHWDSDPPGADIFERWLNSSYRKVVLKADDKEWEKIKSEISNHVVVVDAGLTEIPSGSETVIGLCPMYKSQCPKIIKRLQILK